MRKRCFIVATLTFLVAIVLHVRAYRIEHPSDSQRASDALDRASERSIGRLMRGEFGADNGPNFATDLLSMHDWAYKADWTWTYIAYGASGVLFIVGFIVGPPKKEAAPGFGM